MPTSAEAARLPYREAIDYFRQKVNVPSRHWTTLMDEAHARGFAVAGAADKALIEDFRAAVDKAISQGTGFKAFQKDFDSIVAKHGWVHHGHPQWRARVIYETNMSTAAAAGRYAQATQPEVLRAFPYWEWYHTPVEHPRPQHVAWNGLVLRADDPFWDTHYPPCGWGCRCIVMSLSEGDLRRRGKSGPDASPKIEWREYVNKTTGVVTKVPTGVDPGFVGNPGKIWKEGAKVPMGAPRLVAVQPKKSPADLPIKRFRSAQAAENALKPAMESWGASLTHLEATALDAYKGNFGVAMNRALADENADPVVRDMALTLKNALARASLPDRMELWRAVDGAELRQLLALKLDETSTRKSFISTSVLRDVAQKLAGADGVVIRIIAPAHLKGVGYIHPFPRYRYPQAEVLLNAELAWSIVETDKEITLLLKGDTAHGD